MHPDHQDQVDSAWARWPDNFEKEIPEITVRMLGELVEANKASRSSCSAIFTGTDKDGCEWSVRDRKDRVPLVSLYQKVNNKWEQRQQIKVSIFETKAAADLFMTDMAKELIKGTLKIEDLKEYRNAKLAEMGVFGHGGGAAEPADGKHKPAKAAKAKASSDGPKKAALKRPASAVASEDKIEETTPKKKPAAAKATVKDTKPAAAQETDDEASEPEQRAFSPFGCVPLSLGEIVFSNHP